MGLEEFDDDEDLMYGSFECHRCEEHVGEARYNPDTRVLTWTCSKGHVSKIKDFM